MTTPVAADRPKAPPARPPVSAPTSKRERAAVAGSTILKLGKLKGDFQPPRIVLNAIEGWGKTSCAAFAPNPAILMAEGETGYETLLGAGLVPSVDAARVTGWQALLNLLDELATADAPGTLAVDAISGFERLCQDYTCERAYNGDRGPTGFENYQRGFETTVTDWLVMLGKLDRLQARGTTILLLGHVKVKPFKNPLGPDFDRWISDMHDKTWAVTHKWADAILFGQFESVVEKDKPKDKKGKGIGGSDRVLYTTHHDAYDAKNRYGMPEVIDIPDDPSQTWATIWNAIKHEGTQA